MCSLCLSLCPGVYNGGRVERVSRVVDVLPDPGVCGTQPCGGAVSAPDLLRQNQGN